MEFTKELSYDEFVKDTKTIYAIIRAIEIIGEAVKNIPEDIRMKYPDIPWRSIAGIEIKSYMHILVLKLKEFGKLLKETFQISSPNLKRC